MHIPFIPRRPRVRSAGFTLLEVMVVLAIATIAAMIALPSYDKAMGKYRADNQQRGLRDNLQLAHLQALGQTALTVCASSNGTSCTSGKDWHIGHILFSDDGTIGKVDGSDVILARVEAAKAGDTIVAAEDASNADFTRGYIHFEQGNPDIKKSLRFTVCAKNANRQKIFINMYGHVWTVKETTPCA